MAWGTYPICDRHWKEQNGDRRPVRVVGAREHCYIPGCDGTGDIYVRAFVTDNPNFQLPQNQPEGWPYFVNDRHAFVTGGLLTHLRAIPNLGAEVETDDDGNYRPVIRVAFHDGFDFNGVRLHVELLDEDDAS